MGARIQHFDPRQVMLREDFEIFHYREPKSQGVEVHHHDFYEIYLLLGGAVEYWVEGSLYALEPGDIFLISPMELHRPVVRPEGQYERIVLWINKEFLESLSEGIDLTACFSAHPSGRINMIRPSKTADPSIAARLFDLVKEYSGAEQGNLLAARGIFLQFMVELNRIAAGTPALEQQQKRGSALVEQALSYIHAHSGEELSLEGLAGRFYVSKYYLSHAFSRETGVSVYRYIMLKRLLQAKQMLLAGIAAGEVCYKCGFKDYAGFYRAFKQEYGVSPKVFANTRE